MVQRRRVGTRQQFALLYEDVEKLPVTVACRLRDALPGLKRITTAITAAAARRSELYRRRNFRVPL